MTITLCVPVPAGHTTWGAIKNQFRQVHFLPVDV
jgi:hypothetical protein